MKPASFRKICFAACLVLLLSGISLCVSRPVGGVTAITRSETNGVILTTSSRAKVLVEFFDLNVIRVRLVPNGIFERDFSYAIDYSHDRKTPSIKVAQTTTQIVLTNSYGTKVVVQKTPFSISVFDENGQLIVQDDPKHPITFDLETGEIQATKLRSSEVETYYGFGE